MHIQQGADGGGAECDEDFRLNEFNLRQQIWQAIRRFVGQRCAILWWTTFNHIGDVNIFTHIAHGRDDFGKQITRTPHERHSLQVFIMPRGLTDKHNLRVPTSPHRKRHYGGNVTTRRTSRTLSPAPQLRRVRPRDHRLWWLLSLSFSEPTQPACPIPQSSCSTLRHASRQCASCPPAP